MMTKSYLKFAGSNRRKALYLALAACMPQVAKALPQDGQVTAGQADIHVLDNTMDIAQHTDKVVLEFDSFNVAAGETVNFNQPGSQSVALNRVVGNNLSEIHGAINANGQVFLLNSNGVIFGNGARVQVGGLAVSTLDVSDQDFLAGDYRLQGDSDAAIENRGELLAEGKVALVGAEIRNSGSISANSVQIAGRQAALVELNGSEIPLFVDDAEAIGLVDNSGSIRAENVVIASNQVIENSGLIRAVSMQDSGGEVVLSAPAGDIVHTGSIDVSGEQGGQVSIDSNRYSQTGDIRAEGKSSGGDVAIRSQDTLVMHSGSNIDADAKVQGDGGEITLISERDTWFLADAKLSARGKGVGGDGGFIEVSGFEFVNVFGLVDVGSESGKAGLWYIDPTDITINNTDAGGNFVGSNPHVWEFTPPAPNSSQINITTIVNTLRNEGDVLINTASTAGAAGNITWAAGFDYDGITTLPTLSLIADNDIIVQAGVNITDVNPGTEGIIVNLTAAGNITMDSGNTFALGSGSFIADAGGDIVLPNTLSGDALDITALGGVQIPDAGIEFTNSISITANDLFDGVDRSVILAAPSTALDLSAAGGDLEITTALTELAITNRGTNNINVYDVDDINLVDANPLSGSIGLYSGADSTFVIANDIDLDSSTGALSIVSADSMQIQGSLADLTGASDHTTSLFISAANDIVFNPSALVGGGAGNVFVYAQSGNLTVGEVSGSLVNLVAGGSIIDANGSGLNATADTLALISGNGVASAADPLEIDATELSFFPDAIGITVSGDVFLDAADSVTILDSDVDGALNLTLDSGDLTFVEEAPAFTGAITASTPNGSVIVNDLGLNVTGLLTLTASNFLSQSGGAAQINVSQANLTVSAFDSGAVEIGGNFDNLSLTVEGSQGVTLTDADALQVDQLDNAGNLTLASGAGSDLVIADTTPVWGSQLTLSAGGDLLLPSDAIIDTTNSVNLNAQNVNDGDNEIAISTGQLTLSLAPTALHAFATDVNSLALTATTNQTVEVTETDAVDVTDLQLLGDFTLTAGGDITLANTGYSVDGTAQFRNGGTDVLTLNDAGVSFTGDLVVDTGVIQDSDTTASLAANQADLTLRNLSTTSTLNTQFSNLLLTLLGGGSQTIIDADGLTLDSLSSDGSVDVRATSADLVVTGAVSAATELSLATVASGDLVLPSGAFDVAGILNLSADDLTDGDTTLALSASELNLNLRDASDLTLATATDVLSVINDGNNLIEVVDADGLSVSSLVSAGDVSITATEDHLDLVSASASVAGLLSLQTAGSGDLILADTGISHSGVLSIVADTLRDSDSQISLQATDAIIQLRAANTDLIWDTQVTSLDAAITGSANLTVNETDGLQIVDVQSDANVELISAAGDIEWLNDASGVAGDLTLNAAAGDVLLSEVGLTHAGNLNIAANNLRDSDFDTNLQAASLELLIRAGDSNHSVQTQTDIFTLDYAGSTDFSVIDSDELTLSSVQTAGSFSALSTDGDLVVPATLSVAGDLTLGTQNSGDVVLADAGLSHTGAVSITADTLRDSDDDISLQATEATIQLRALDRDTTWNTQFDEVSANITGSGQLSLLESDGLAINTLQTAGDLAVATTNADLIVNQGALTVGGTLTLQTQLSGDLVVPESGLSHNGAVILVADNLRGATDYQTQIQADSLALTVREGDSAHTLDAQVSQFSLDFAGDSIFNLNNTGTLEIGQVQSAGDLIISTTQTMDVSQIVANVAGDLGLTAGGEMTFAEQGIEHDGTLSLAMQDWAVVNDAPMSITAANLDLAVAAPTQAGDIRTQVDALDLTWGGNSAVTILNSGDLSLGAITTGAGASIASTTNLNIIDSNLNVSGVLQLTAADQLQLPVAGLVHNADLYLDANRLVSEGGGAVLIEGTVANVQLRGAQDLVMQTAIDQLSYTSSSGGTLILTNDRALQLAGFNASLLSAVNLAIDGVLEIPDSGLNLGAGDWQIVANDLLDSDRLVDISGRQGLVKLSQVAGNSSWNVDLQALDASIEGNGGLSITSQQALRVGDLDGDSNALTLANGNLTLTVNAGDLGIDGLVLANDAVDDGVRLGTITLNATAGNVVLGQDQTTVLESNQSAETSSGNSEFAVAINLTDESVNARTIFIGDSATVRAINGDILLNARDSSAPADSVRVVEYGDGALIEAYNDSNDPVTGTVLLNGSPVVASSVQKIHQGRLLSIREDADSPTYDDILDDYNDLDADGTPDVDTSADGQTADAQFVKVFGACNELDPNERQRCRIDGALKRFLSHWLIGGEMPPRTEIQ